MAVDLKISSVALALAFTILAAVVHGQGLAPAPAPAPTSDGNAIDQGIACFLMLLALAVTYLIHTFDSPFLL